LVLRVYAQEAVNVKRHPDPVDNGHKYVPKNVVADDDPETEDGHEEDHQRHAEHPREEKSAKAFAYSLDEQNGESDEQQTEEDDERSG